MANENDERKMTPLNDVLEGIRDERAYQLKCWGYPDGQGSLHEPSHGVCDFLCYMKAYLDDAIQASAKKAGNADAIATMMKVVTLGVACMEQNGIPARRGDGPVMNKRDGLVY